MQLTYLSLFSGIGGGDLAFQHLLDNFKCIGYIDNETYCQKVIRQRQIDGLFDKAPIFGDIRTFIDSGCAALYQGLADVITAGFPCQPFSVAGKRKGEQDERNMWPWTIATIRLVRPRYAFLENVPGLLASGYMPRIFADLAEAGYHARWTVLGADDVGAPHRRKRLWILANSIQPGLERFAGDGNERNKSRRKQTQQNRSISKSGLSPVNSKSGKSIGSRPNQKGGKILAEEVKKWLTPSVSDTRTDIRKPEERSDRANKGGCANLREQAVNFPTPSSSMMTDADMEQARFAGNSKNRPDYKNAGKGSLNPDWVEWLMGWPIKWSSLEPIKELVWFDWAVDPAEIGAIPRVATNIKNRVDRLKAIGNGQVSQVVALAWEILNNS